MVFKARHRRLNRIVALKILPPSFARDRTAVLRFKREVEAAGRLKHPNIVAALDADEDRGVHFLVMEYVEGRDLDQLVRQRGPLSVVQAIDFLVQAARGLEAAHAEGIVHRDIKPSNLMLDSQGVVRVLDLGLARIVEASQPLGEAKGGAGRLTESGMYMGTVDYMAPEQAEDSRRADHLADIYSLGCTLFFLLAGREPFGGETDDQAADGTSGAASADALLGPARRSPGSGGGLPENDGQAPAQSSRVHGRGHHAFGGVPGDDRRDERGTWRRHEVSTHVAGL